MVESQFEIEHISEAMCLYFVILCCYNWKTGVRNQSRCYHTHAFQVEFQYYHNLVKYIHLLRKP